MKRILILLVFFIPVQAMDRPPLEGTKEWKRVRREVDRTVKEVEKEEKEKYEAGRRNKNISK